MLSNIIRLAVAVIVLCALLPSPARAAVISPQCVALDTKYQKVLSDLDVKAKPISQLRIKNSYDNSQALAVMKSKIAASQKDSDKKLKTIVQKLSDKAKTSAQKTAMTSFETEFSAALKTLRISQEAARANYEASFNGLVTAHRAAVDSQLATLKKQFDSAHTTAAAQCAKTGVEKVTAQLKSDMKLAEDTYSLAPNVSGKNIQAALQTAATNFKTVNDKATLDFTTTFGQSQAKLKAAFGNTKYIF